MATVITSSSITINGKEVGAAPSGTVAYFGMDTAPSGWLEADGAAVSRTTYADLFTAIGTTYGVGDGSTTFNVPDLRGEFVRGWDNGKGTDSGRTIGSSQGFAQQNITFSVAGSQEYLSGGSGSGYSGSSTSGTRPVNGSYTDRPALLDSSREVTTAAEVRPTNVAMLACIKY